MEVTMELMKIIMLAVLLFLVYPAIMTRYAHHDYKLGVFVGSISAPLFAWMVVYLSLNGFFLLGRGNLLENSLSLWLMIYLSLQIGFVFVLKKFQLLTQY